MELDKTTLALAFLLSSSLVFFLLRGRREKKLNLPPGPKPWPLIGNMNLIGSLPHHSIHSLSQKYGPIMQLYFCTAPVVVGSSVAMAREFLKIQDHNFLDRPRAAVGKYNMYNCADITWSPYNPYWRYARKLCAVELFNQRRLAFFEYIRVEELRIVMKEMFNSSGTPTVLKDQLFTLTLNVISRMVLGKKFSDGSNMKLEEFKELLDELVFLTGALNIGDFVPWLDFLDLQGYVKRMKKAAKKNDDFLEHVVREHEERRQQEKEGFVARDFVDILLQLADEPEREIKLTRDNIKAFILEMIAGGTDTSSVTLEWAISEMLRRPHVFLKAAEELDRVVGKDRWVEEKDIPNLPYIEAITKEAMRMHPASPLLAPHLSTVDCTVNGYDIPAGTRILINVWGIGRDPSVWDSPNEFQPERFIGSDIDVKGNHFELLPFGAGRRMCPGYPLGLKMIQLTIANLLHGFSFKLPSDQDAEKLNMDEIFGLSASRKYPLEVIMEPRLDAQLYA